MSNLVAMALTLAGPRLWILIKALLFWIIGIYKKLRKNRSTHKMLQNHPILLSHNLTTTHESHSELGAARELIQNVWEEIRPNHIRLTIDPAVKGSLGHISRWRQCIEAFIQFWSNFLQRPAEIIISLALSAIFIGFFVAESSGSVLSANIISNSTGLASSPACPSSSTSAYNYMTPQVARLCIDNSRRLSPRCSSYSDQVIPYTEQMNTTCPFKGKICSQGRNLAHTFDTGYVSAKYIGLNAARQYLFRRTATCAPLVADGELIIQTKGESANQISDWKINAYGCNLLNATYSSPFGFTYL